jgi:cytochrome c-type biogenesis protein
VEFWQGVLLPVALGLLGFVEPCSVAAHGLFAAYLRARPAGARRTELLRFAATRAAVFGLLGLGAALAGQVVLAARGAVNLALGVALVALGVAYAVRGGRLPALGSGVGRYLAGHRDRSAPLGLVAGLSLPACATPLLLAALAAGASAAGILQGFLALFLFGVALSLPLLALLAWPGAAERLRRATAGAGRRPLLTGTLLILLGVFTALVER